MNTFPAIQAFVILAATLLFHTPTSARDLPSFVEQAVAISKAQEKGRQTAPYFKQFLYPFFHSKYTPVVHRCFADTPDPDERPFTFVVAIDEEGKVLRIYRDAETNIFLCMQKELKNEVFLIPPAAPLYFHVAMQFTK